MRNTVAKLLRRFSDKTGRPYKMWKKKWTKLPRNKRGALREEIERFLNAPHS